MSKVSPLLAGRMAHLLFTTPLKTGRLSPAEKRLEARAEIRLKTAENIGFQNNRQHIAAYRFGRKKGAGSKRIILVHGWMSGARYMLAMVDPLLALGHEVICFDLPAHGASQGKRTNLVACAEALDQLMQRVGDTDIIVAHSFGGAVTAFALSRLRGNSMEKGGLNDGGHIILLASPNQLCAVTAGFSKTLGINAKAQHVYEEKLCTVIGATLAEMDGNIMYAQAGYPLKILHCVDDAEVSIEQSRRYHALGEQAQLTELQGLGHRRILYHPRALEALIRAV